MLDVKKAVKMLAIERGVKTGQLAKALGMKQQTLSSWLYRPDTPKVNTAEEILSQFGCHLAIVDDETGEVLFQ